MRKILVEEIEYFVEISGDGPPIVLLHGFTGNGSTWKEIVPVLSGSFQVIAIDIIGHGKTASPVDIKRYEMDSVARDISFILDELELDKTYILGYSMGGRLALSFTALFPCRVNAIILESASPGLKTAAEKQERKKQDELLAKRILQKGIKNFVDYWEQIPLFATQKRLPLEIQEQIRSQRLSNSPLGLANSLLGMGTGAQPSWWEHLHMLKMPVLLVCGEDDQKFCHIAEEMNLLLPNAQLSFFEATGHAVHVEHPQKFGTIVEEFLKEVVYT